jgi:twitching motility two-component system response regulator PilG
MNQIQYQIPGLNNILEDFHRTKTSGTLHLKAQISSEQKTRSRVLIWQNGKIIYGGSNIPSREEFLKQLFQSFKSGWNDTAIRVAKEKATNPKSIRELLEIIVKIRVLNWEQIETFFRHQAVLTLEQVLPHTGQFKLDRTVEIDLGYSENYRGLDLSILTQAVALRQQEWAKLAPTISSIDAVPYLPENGLQIITDPAVRQHLQQWVDGKRSLVDIAEELSKDPLQLARSYLNWAQAGWVVFNSSTTTIKNDNLPTILSVDDSHVIQTMIKRALGDRYNVLLASNAVDALNLMNQKQISLLLLDVTMPDIDGLEMCRTVRSIPKFRHLPIIMLTARDGFFDKVKGQIAGTNRYLTKPFDAEKLLEIVSEFVGDGNTSDRSD